jgi:hypothetical protein
MESSDSARVTVRQLATRLGLPTIEVMRALMTYGRMKAADSPLTDDEIEVVTLLLAAPPIDGD